MTCERNHFCNCDNSCRAPEASRVAVEASAIIECWMCGHLQRHTIKTTKRFVLIADVFEGLSCSSCLMPLLAEPKARTIKLNESISI